MKSLQAKGGVMDQAKVMMRETEKFREKNMRKIWISVTDFKPDAILTGLLLNPFLTRRDNNYFGMSRHCSKDSGEEEITSDRKVPLFVVSTIPFSPTNEFPPPAAFTKTPGMVNKLLYWGSNKFAWSLMSTALNKFRGELHVTLFSFSLSASFAIRNDL